MSPDVEQDGRPVVGPLPTRLLVLFGVGLLVLVVSAVLSLLGRPFPAPDPLWRPVVAVAGIVLVAGGAAQAGWMVLRGRTERVVRRGTPQASAPWSEYRRLRRTLLAGGELTDADRVRIANQLAGASSLRLVSTVLGCLVGTNLLSLSVLDGPVLPYMAALSAAAVACLVPLTGVRLWLRSLRRPAEAAGAAPLRAG